MATVDISNGTLNVTMRLWDRILAVHGSLHIPLQHIRAADAQTAPDVPWFSKLVGTNVPGVKAAGTFFADGLAFYDYGAGHTCLVLDLVHDHFVRAVIEIDPPQTAEEAAALVRAAISSSANSP